MKTIQSNRLSDTRYVVLLLLFSLFPSFAAASSVSYQESASEVMMGTFESGQSERFLQDIYTQLYFVPVWTTEDSITSLATALFEKIASDRTLDPTSMLKEDSLILEKDAKVLYSGHATLKEKVDLEFRISRLYNRYAEYSLYGSINWGAFDAQLYNLKAESITAGWVPYKPQTDPVTLLQEAILEGSLNEAFAGAEPKSYHFRELKQKLIEYLELQAKGGEWKPIPYSSVIKLGKSNETVPLIRERLKALGDYKRCEVESTLYDACMEASVIAFQQRHGLESDGVIGKQTVQFLNIPLQERIDTIRLNLDRIKWLIPRCTARHIIINIPAFRLFIEDSGVLNLQMKVITGKRRNPTPVFSDTVETVVLNPNWNVPKSIIQKEMIPKLLRNPNALRKERINIYTGWGRDARRISAGDVNWANYRYTKNLPFRFVQPPGDDNALGKVKFLFPNRFSVYMHDTPTKPLFSRTSRAFSHGCIRLEQPLEMLRFFSELNANIDYVKALKKLEGNRNEHIQLQVQVPVDVVYLTAFVDYNGTLQYRPDIYLYDRMQLSTLREW
ncbi:L,D-transpeptidase family protein [Sulfurovum sp. zt1-1]|uniref:L,D-transpeptidase family protein n=1 Tax=Sulfurovum zhangzhouensis TaxID=3019067 RepID=A0ABT7R0I8_9BACT|nr:L,D-transpeptidase family protein [Sulfurovum zhangzhouensis]MDM5272558.1 L,D-transpeptidase family protein [Sulfurovum zhangzhouensis]